jgi:hypothetical protein
LSTPERRGGPICWIGSVVEYPLLVGLNRHAFWRPLLCVRV